MITVTLPYARGEPVWHATRDVNDSWVQCPECMGTRVVTLTLGTGEAFQLDCAACRDGYDPSRGVVRKRDHKYAPARFTPHRFSIDQDGVRYSESPPDASSYSHVHARDLWTSLEECAAACDVLNAQYDKEFAEQQYNQFRMKRKD